MATLAIAGAIAAFNYAVDPYLLFNVQRTPGFNNVKPSAETRERMMKAYQIQRTSARTMVIGTSRPDLGLDPATPSWPSSARPVYNLGLVGAPLADSVKYLRHYVAAHDGKGPETLIVGLDFEDFLRLRPTSPTPSDKPHVPNEMEERLLVDMNGRPNSARLARVMQDRAQGLLSLDALEDSVQTLLHNRWKPLSDLEPNGHLSEAAMRDAVRADGYALVFDQKNRDTINRYAKPRRYLTDTSDGPMNNADAIQDLLAFSKQHDIGIIFTIQPSHVSRLELLDQMGYWPEYEHWKRVLTDIVAQADANQRVTLWDFSGFEEPMRESVPPKGKGTMRWFWDPVHYNSKLGDRIVARLFGTNGSEDLGVRLTPQNIDTRIAQVRQDRDTFRATMPQETARLARLVCGLDNCQNTPGLIATAH